jgi:clan AA aspartic protease
MIHGQVSAERIAECDLEVLDAAGNRVNITAAVDTGFNGFLMLPAAMVQPLGLALLGLRSGELSDGRHVDFPVLRGFVIWDGQPREILIIQAEGGMIIGMSLLEGSRLTIDAAKFGAVTIEPLTPEKLRHTDRSK